MKPSKKKGWIYPECTIEGNRKDIIDACLEPQPFWDDWVEGRDGMRGYNDNTRIKPETHWFLDCFDSKRWNKKLKRLLYRRRAKKKHPRNETKRNK